MDRRESLKLLLAGSLATGFIGTSCTTETDKKPERALQGYGRNEQEKIHDRKVMEADFLSDHEIETIAVLCDLILPSTAQFGSARQAGVVEFIDFIVKDMPWQQMPIRGGIAWLDTYSCSQFDAPFKELNEVQQKTICDRIAWPGKTPKELLPGEKLFTRMRNLTLTGYYTSPMGIKDLGYKGNSPGIWDGVPQDEMDRLGLAYEKEWLAKCVDHSQKDVIARWDEEGNLLT